MVPDELFDKIRRLEIRMKGMVDSLLGGEYSSAFKGRGIEFAEVRPYQIGDDVRSIDWNVSARMNETYVKTYEEEREQNLMLLVDISRSGDFGSQSKFKREIAAELCALVAFSAIKNNDKVGLLLFTDQVELFIPPKKGRRHVLRLIRELFTHERSSTGTDLSVALDHLMRIQKRRSIVLIISDFLDDGYDRPLRSVAGRHDTVAAHLIDPREEMLPNMGLVDLTDAETGSTALVDTRSRQAREAFTEAAQSRRQATIDRLRRARVDYVPIRTDEDHVEPLIRFFRQRNRTA